MVLLEHVIDLLGKSILLFIQLFGLSIVFAYILTWISRSLKGVVNSFFGHKGQLFFGWIGIIIHELGHLIFAILFRHRIDKVNLLNLSSDDGSLGSVSHSYKKYSLFNNIGHYFIGIAPIFTCAFSIIGLYLILFRDSIPLFVENIQGLIEHQDMMLFFHSVLDTLMVVDYSFLKSALFILVVLNIVTGGFDLSDSDYKSIYGGIIPIFFVSVLVTFIIQVFFKDIVLTNWILGLNVALGITLGTSLLIGLVTLLMVRGIILILFR